VNSPIERRRGYTHRPGLTRRVVLALGAGGAAAVASASVPYRVLAASPAGQLTWGSTPYAYGSYPDIDALFPHPAAELDHKKRAAILEKMQQLLAERMVYAPVWELGFLNGVGPRVGQSGFGLMPGYAYTAPYEDITLKGA